MDALVSASYLPSISPKKARSKYAPSPAARPQKHPKSRLGHANKEKSDSNDKRRRLISKKYFSNNYSTTKTLSQKPMKFGTGSPSNSPDSNYASLRRKAPQRGQVRHGLPNKNEDVGECLNIKI